MSNAELTFVIPTRCPSGDAEASEGPAREQSLLPQLPAGELAPASVVWVRDPCHEHSSLAASHRWTSC
jgi:hypothetical protein